MKTLLKLFVLFLTLFGLHGAALAQQNRAAPAAAPGSNRPSVAVSQLQDLAETGQTESFLVMIQTALASTNRFRVVERDFRGLMAEQNLAATGRVRSNTPGRRGGFSGADFLIQVTISQGQTSTSTSNGCRAGNVLARVLERSVAGNASEASACRRTLIRLGIDIRIVEAGTGVVRYADSVMKDVSSQDDGSPDYVGLFRDSADSLAHNFTLALYPIQIAAIQPDGVFMLNYGDDTLSVGDILNISGQQTECVRDPTTGECLTNETAVLGQVRVVEVTPRFSRATPVRRFAVTPEVGSVARIVPRTERGNGNRNRSRDRN